MKFKLLVRVLKAKSRDLAFRTQGSVLLSAMIFGSIVLSLGMSVMHTLVKDMELTADLLFSERAYFSAESGIERALIYLQNEPVQNIQEYQEHLLNAQGEFFGTDLSLTINNLKEEFEFILPAKGNTKFRLKQDVDETKDILVQIPSDFDVEVLEAGTTSALGTGEETWQWGFLCQKEDNSTVALQEEEMGGGSFLSFMSKEGKFSNQYGVVGMKRVSDFLHDLSFIEKNSCFISITNLREDKDLHFTFKNVSGLSPDRAVVSATGASGTREKTIQFDFRQKNLATVFDFLLFHRD